MSNEIRPIEEESVRRIVAGQAVTDLASAVKELVDNALDAGSQTINIRLFNQGIDIVEVTDDGCGIPPASRPYVATPHATSKIQSFDDIYEGSQPLSMGFRGEALFCLANLSGQVILATRTAQEEVAQKLTFHRDGSLDVAQSNSLVPRKVGATVAVCRLLEALPVRRADLVRRIARQRQRLFRWIEAYAIFSVGVHLTLMDMLESGEPKVLLESPANTSSLRDTMAAVKGSTFLASLCPLVVDLSAIVNGGGGGTNEGGAMRWKVDGYVSKAGQRSTSGKETQVFCINGRPVELPKVSRLLNELWRNVTSGTKKPSCVLQLVLPNKAFDINLSPDKRQVILTAEQAILDAIRESVSKLWASQTEGKFQAGSTITSLAKNKTVDTTYESAEEEDDDDDDVDETASPSRFNRRYAFSHDLSKARLQHEYDDGRRRRRSTDEQQNSSTEVRVTPPETSAEEKKLDEGLGRRAQKRPRNVEQQPSDPPKKPSGGPATDSVTPPPGSTVSTVTNEKTSDDRPTDAERRQWNSTLRSFNSSDAGEEPQSRIQGFDQFRAPSQSGSDANSKGHGLERFAFTFAPKKYAGSNDAEAPAATSSQSTQKRSNRSKPVETTEEEEEETDSSQEEETVERPNQREPTTVWTNFQGTDAVVQASNRERVALRNRKRAFRDVSTEASSDMIDLQAGNSGDLTPSTTASESATVSLPKGEFRNMTVIGQFNMGFILARSEDNGLWIFDQHACDEKFNFEKLCRETVIREQKLISPMPLELSPSEEACVMENLDIFGKNGFRFAYDANKPPRHRLSLTSIPDSGAAGGRKSVQFGKDDVSALCAILDGDGSSSAYDGSAGTGTGVDGSGMYGNNAVRRYAGSQVVGGGDTADKVIARLPKAIAMFASRACRGSIMIGQALSQKEMDRIVKRLDEVEHPWNCPHGRPTMQHGGDLSCTMLDDETKAAQYISGPTLTVLTQEEPST